MADYHYILNQDPSYIEKIPSDMVTEDMCILVLDKTNGNLSLIPKSFRNSKACLHALRLNPKCPIFLLDQSLLTRDFIIEYCVTNPEYLRYGNDFNSELPEWSYEILCTEVAKINGLTLQYVLQDRQTIEMCREAINQTKMALPYINIYLFELSDIFAEYQIPIRNTITEYKTILVDEIVNNPKVVYFDMSEHKSYIYNDHNPSEESMADLIARSVNKPGKTVSSVKKSVSGTMELYYSEKKTINNGRIFNNFVEVSEEKLLGVIDPNPKVVL